MSKPSVFVGSGSESLGIVDALESELRSMAEIKRWDIELFRPGRFLLEELTEAVKKFDFAILCSDKTM